MHAPGKSRISATAIVPVPVPGARLVPPWIALSAALCLLFAAAAQAASTLLLRGHVPPPVASLTPSGRLSASTNLNLAVGLALRNQAALTNLLRQIYDPASPNYQHYLTVEQFADQFGPTQEQSQAVKDFLVANNFTVTGTHPNRLLVDVAGSVADIERTFHLTLRTFTHPTEDRAFFAPDLEPSISVSLPILDISGLDNYMPPRPVNLKVVPRDAQTRSYATGSGPSGDFIGFDLHDAYAPGVMLTGFGQVIGLFEFGTYFTNDVILYQQQAGLPTNIVITNILLDGLTGVPSPGTDDGEETLDIDMARSMAPGASIMVYEGNSAIDILSRIATDNKAKQISCSFGFYPPPGTMDNVFLEFATQGQNFFAAAGDGGAYNSSQTIFAPADDPNITSVGGTSLTTAGQRGPWQSETTWIGSGGGITPHYGIPTYQQGMSMVTNHGSTTQRNFPDVSILADTVLFWFLKDGQSGTVGGTSAAAPLWAGFMALINQQAEANGKKSLGFLNPIIYAIGRGSNNYTTLFHDITTGNNTNSGSPNNFFGVPGYDLATGWGSPNGSNLIDVLAAPTDSLHITPGIGFTLTTPQEIPFGAAATTFSLTNAGAAALSWTLANTSAWLTVSATNGALPPASSVTTLTVSLNTAATTNLTTGTYYSTVWITNTTSGIVQSRLFTLIVSGANFPIAISGFNAGVIVPTNATTASPKATGFDIANNICFYQAGLNANPQVSGSGGAQGLPQSGSFASQVDGTTVFQFGQYGATNVLLLGYTHASSGVLRLTNPQAYNSLAILASSANGGGLGTCVINFTNGAHSQSFGYNAQDWFNTSANVALQGFGRLDLNSGLSTEDNGTSNPNLYQTTINLAALGLNQAIASITFNDPSVGGNQDAGVFAVNGALMPPQVAITQQPQSTANNNPAQGASINVVAMGSPPLAYQWYSGSPGSGTPLSDGNGLSGSATASLTFSAPIQTNYAGNYFVVITNNFGGATSVVATLTVYTTPVITQQPSPTNLWLFAGQSTVLSVGVAGAIPLYYQWLFNGAPISGATSSSDTLANLQLTNSGNYSVVVSNAFGVLTSSVVALTVVATPSYPFGQIVLADHPIGYWRLDETSGTVAHDYVGAHNGTYTNALLGQTGDHLIDTHTAARFGVLASINSYVANIPIDFANPANASFSVEAWVDGNAQSSDAGIITKGTGAGGEQFNLDTGNDGTPNHAFRFFVRDAGGGAHLANGTIAPNGQWHHLVGVCAEPQGQVILYIDGVSNAVGSITAGSGLLSSANAVTFGSRQSGVNTPYDTQFVGTGEEFAIYNYVLTPAQVQTHFHAATNRPPVFLENPFSEPAIIAGQPYSNTIATNAADPNGNPDTFALLSGPAWLAVSSGGQLSGTPLSSAVGTNNFLVSVADSFGLSNSATMTILVTPAPAITATAGLQSTKFLLSWVGGIAPFQVQFTTNLASPNWQNFGAPISATNLTLSPSNDAGFYRVLGQ